jgi:hypothetical protein
MAMRPLVAAGSMPTASDPSSFGEAEAVVPA